MNREKFNEEERKNPKVKVLLSEKFAPEMLTFIGYLRHAPKAVQDILAPYAVFLAGDKFKENKTIQSFI